MMYSPGAESGRLCRARLCREWRSAVANVSERGGWRAMLLKSRRAFGTVEGWVVVTRVLLLYLSTAIIHVLAVSPRIDNDSTTIYGDLISSTAWHARTLTNISWDIPADRIHRLHLIVVSWDEAATETWRFGDDDNDTTRADTPPSLTSSWTSYYVPPIAQDEALPQSCAMRYEVYTPSSNDTFYVDEQRALGSSDLADSSTWWYVATSGQEEPTRTSNTSTIANASVLLSEPGLYVACLLLGNETCYEEECVNITVYQPPYDFIEIESTNIGAVVTVRFNLVTRYAYPGDWAWILGGVDPSFSVEEANALEPIEVASTYEERCWFYFGRAIELERAFVCSPDPDYNLAALQSTSTVRAYQYGRFQFYSSSAGDESLWFAKHEYYTYALVQNFHTCGISVQSLDSQLVNTTHDLTVTAIPEQGHTCEVDEGIELWIRTGEVISPTVREAEAWTYFTGRLVGLTSDGTKLSIRLPYQGEHSIMVYLMSGALLDTLQVTAIASDPYAPSCQVTTPPPGSSPIGSSIQMSLIARDFYANNVTLSWGDDAFSAWTFNSASNKTSALVSDDGGGAFSVGTGVLSVTGTTFLFMERNGLGVPGSPFEVFFFGPSSCQIVSTVGDCGSHMFRKVTQSWALNSACNGYFDPPTKPDVPCGFVPVSSLLGVVMIACSILAALYAALYLAWIRGHRQSTTVRLSQPFVCQLFLMGCILLNLTVALHVGRPTDMSCVARPWVLHVALTFTSSCLYIKTYRVHRLFNSSKLSRISISDRQLVTWVLQLVAVDILMLSIWTAVDRPRKINRREVFSGFEAEDPVCETGSGIAVFSILLWVWKACLNVFGVVMGAKTWHCEDGVGESQPICLSVYNTTLLGLVNLAVHFLLADRTGVVLGASSLTAVAGSAFTVSVLFGPKVYRLWLYGDIPSNTTGRGSSGTITMKTARTSSLERRHSSITGVPTTAGALVIDFMKAGGKVQPNENPTQETGIPSSTYNLVPSSQGADRENG